MSIQLFVGDWKSSGAHTNPEEPIAGEPDSSTWPLRSAWQPDDDVTFHAYTDPKNIYHDYDSPKTTPTKIQIIKFKVTNSGTLDPALIYAIESADYHYFESGILISTPMRLESATWVVDVIEYLPIGSSVPGKTGKTVNEAMRHNLVWQDGLRAKWICCPKL